MSHGISEKLMDEVNTFLTKYEKNQLLIDSKYKNARHDSTATAVYFLLHRIEELQTRVEKLEGK